MTSSLRPDKFINLILNLEHRVQIILRRVASKMVLLVSKGLASKRFSRPLLLISFNFSPPPLTLCGLVGNGKNFN